MSQIEIHSNKPKLRRKIFLGGIVLLVTFLLCVNFLPVQKRPSQPFFTSERPLVISHQGGELLAPSNTMASFTLSKDLGVDVLEFDIHISKDGHLVAIHDPTVDRTTNGTGAVSELTLKEIQALDAGYHFKDLEGNFSYRGKGIYIPTLEEIFEEFPDLRMNIEIKDDNPPERLDDISKKLASLIKKYKMEEKVIVASFDQSIIKKFNQYSDGEVSLAGGKNEVISFVVFHKFFLRNLYQPKVDAFQLPTSESIFDLTDQKLIEGAHRRGMDIHYWTIDDKETMRKLIELGADGIITNRPDILLDLLKEMGY